MSPALTGRFSTTEPPGKSCFSLSKPTVKLLAGAGVSVESSTEIGSDSKLTRVEFLQICLLRVSFSL